MARHLGLQRIGQRTQAEGDEVLQRQMQGRVVPESLLVQISNIKGEQESLLKDIERFEETRKQASAGFVADRARLAQLLGLAP